MWQLNLGSCNFGLKSFQIEFARMISDQIVLHSVQLSLQAALQIFMTRQR